VDDDEAWSRLNLPDPGIALLAEVITCGDVDLELRDMAMNHPSISDDELLTFLETLSEGVALRCIAATTRVAVLHHYMLEGNDEQRRTVAFNPAADITVIMLALADDLEKVRSNAMYNPALSEEQVAWHRENDPSPEVRRTAAVALEDEFGKFLRSGRRVVYQQEDGTLEFGDAEPEEE
jgi:hypothetical protein